MHLGVEATSLAGDWRGIGRYTRQLLRHFVMLRPDLQVTLYAATSADRAALAAELPALRCLPGQVEVAPTSAARSDRLDILWCPWGRIKYRSKARRCVVTIHDLAPFYLESRSWLRRLDRWRRRRRLYDTARSADLILTDSQYSRADILAHLGAASDHVIAIPLAADDFVPADGATDRGWLAQRFGLAGDYFLFVGAKDRRKNLPRLRAAFQALRDGTSSTAQLVICGHQAPKGQAEAGVMYVGWVTEAELRALYQGACAFILPSLLEGFGLPVLEAMASGAPVICSNTTSLPEVAGNAALYFDPRDVSTLTNQMARCLADPALRSDLSARGLVQARQFRWEDTARRTLAAFDAALAT